MPDTDTKPLLDGLFLAKLEQLELVSRKIFLGVMKGERRSKRKGQSVEFADYRNYVKGDDLRFLDWNLYARLDRLFLRLFMEEEDLHFYVLIDNSLSMDFGTPTKLHYARQIAAALAFIGLVNMDRVVIEAFNERLTQSLPAVRGRRSLFRVLDFLQKLEPAGPSNLRESLRAFSLKSSGKGVVVLLTDLMDKGGYQDALRYLVARQFDIYVIQILSQEEIEPEILGDLKLVDIEDNDEAEITVSAPLMKRYKQNLAAYQASIQEYCNRRGITFLTTSNQVPFDRLVLTYLRQRGLDSDNAMRLLINFLKNAWFPVAMIGLFLFALPGLILVLLILLDLDRELQINRLLEENLSISYQLAINPWIALGLLSLPLIILILYFLKLKRRPIHVPSTFLWKKSIEDVHVNTLFQWLRQNVLLVLQILAVLFLIYSVLGLRIHGQTTSGRHYILMIDNSASMSATDVGPNRLEWAKQEALKEIDAAGDNDHGMVIAFNSKAQTLQAYTNNRAKLRDAVKSIEPTHRPTRIDEALTLADSLANPARSTEEAAVEPADMKPEQRRSMPGQGEGIEATVHLYSDGRFAKLSEATLASLNPAMAANNRNEASGLGKLTMRYHMAGKAGAEHVDNVGIISLGAVRYSDDPLKLRKPGELDAQTLLITARVANYRAERCEVKLRVDVFVDGQLFLPKQQTLVIPARKVTPADEKNDKPEEDRPGEKGIDLRLPPLDLGKHIVLHAYLDRHKDDFPLDDEAWLAVSVLRKAQVLIVSGPNRALDSFFDSETSGRLANVERLTPADLGTPAYRKHARSGDVDLVIFDRCTPKDEADMPLANTYFIDEVPPPWHKSKATFRPPVVIPAKGNHALLRYLTTLGEVRIAEAFEFDVRRDLDAKAAEELKPAPEEEEPKRVLSAPTRILETSGQRSLLFSLGRGPYVDVVQTFALVDDRGDYPTDWVFQPSFPLFFRNVLYTLGKVDDGIRPAGVQPGEPMVLRPEAGVETLLVTPPRGSPIELPRGGRPDFVFGDTERVGIYKYQAVPAGTLRSFAVNLLDANESNIEPREEIKIGSERVTTGQERQQPREMWKWILLVAAALLAAEWIVYNRRVAV